MTWDGLLVSSGSLSLLWFLPFLRLDSVFCFDSVATPQLSDEFLSLLRVHFYCLQRALICHPIKKKKSQIFFTIVFVLHSLLWYTYEFYFYIFIWFCCMLATFFPPDTNSQRSYSLVLLSARKPMLSNFWDRTYKRSDLRFLHLRMPFVWHYT